MEGAQERIDECGRREAKEKKLEKPSFPKEVKKATRKWNGRVPIGQRGSAGQSSTLSTH